MLLFSAVLRCRDPLGANPALEAVVKQPFGASRFKRWGEGSLGKREGQMNVPWQILVASSDLESRRNLMQTLSRQGLDPIGVSNLAECQDTLTTEKVGLIFCDRHLADGTYRDLLERTRTSTEKIRVVVTSRHPDWDEYLEAMRNGAFDVIASPCRPTDVEWMVIQARRDERIHSKELLPAGSEVVPLRRAAAGSTA